MEGIRNVWIREVCLCFYTLAYFDGFNGSKGRIFEGDKYTHMCQYAEMFQRYILAGRIANFITKSMVSGDSWIFRVTLELL